MFGDGKVKNQIFYIRLAVLLLVTLLGLTGILSIAVSNQSAAEPLAMVWKQLFRLVVGVVVLYGASQMSFERWKKLFPFCALFFFILLLLLLNFGVRVNGMRGWFRYGGTGFQPSEPGKVFFLAGLVLLHTHPRLCAMKEWKRVLITAIYTLCWIGVLLLQPDMGTAAIYGATFIITLALSRIKWRYIFFLIFSGVISFIAAVLAHPYAMRRIEGFLYPELDPLGKGWHLRQFLFAASRGEWFGVKSSNAVWSRGYLPFALNDSAFAAITETLGAVGASLIPLGFMVLAGIMFFCGDRLDKYPDRRIFVISAGFMMIFQSFLHISINIGLFPITGITLLFVSYGGSSIISGALLAGIALSAINTGKETSSVEVNH